MTCRASYVLLNFGVQKIAVSDMTFFFLFRILDKTRQDNTLGTSSVPDFLLAAHNCIGPYGTLGRTATNNTAD